MKKIFIAITIILTIIFAVDSMNSFAYIFGGKLAPGVYITPIAGIVVAMLFAAMPDDKNQRIII